MIVKDLRNSFNPVPKKERIKDKKQMNKKRHNCEYCGKKSCWTNSHHVKSKGSGGDDTKENLIELCGNCHVKVHIGEINKKELLKIIKDRSN